MSVTRWITQNGRWHPVIIWSKKPPRSQRFLYFGSLSKGPFADMELQQNKFKKLFPSAWAALDATRVASGMAGPVEVVVSIEPKGEGK